MYWFSIIQSYSLLEDLFMKNENAKIVLSTLAALLSTILSDAIPNLYIRLAFIICFVAGLMAVLSAPSEERRHKKKLAAGMCMAASFLLLMSSTLTNDITARDYIMHVRNFFIQKDGDALTYASHYQQMRSINQSIDRLTADFKNEPYKQKLDELDDNIQKLIFDIDTYRFWEDKEDQQEVDAILKEIRKEGSPFLTQPLNEYQTEIAYKLYLSILPYHYYNIIKAMESMGIDCAAYEIDEYKLIMWDAERLFAYYNMKKNMETKLAENPTYELFEQYYNDYKVRNERYEDDLDYKNWRFKLSDVDTNSIMARLDTQIMSYFNKFSINFKPSVTKAIAHAAAYR